MDHKWTKVRWVPRGRISVEEGKSEFCAFFRRSVEDCHRNGVGGRRGGDLYSNLSLPPASEASRKIFWPFLGSALWKKISRHFVAEGGSPPGVQSSATLFAATHCIY